MAWITLTLKSLWGRQRLRRKDLWQRVRLVNWLT